jgi:hypothetical protein
MLHWPARAQSVATAQACPVRSHAPGIGGHCALLVHAALLPLQVPLASGHATLLLTKHGNVVIVQCPAWVGHRFGGQTALVSEQ